MNKDNDRETVIPGVRITSLDEFWLETGRSLTKESINSLENAAKQLITAVTLLQGLYFAAISFSDIKTAMDVEGLAGWFKIILFTGPIILWLGCLSFAVQVFKPKSYPTNLQSPDIIRANLKEIVETKKTKLDQAYVLLQIGFVVLIAALLYYIKYLPNP